MFFERGEKRVNEARAQEKPHETAVSCGRQAPVAQEARRSVWLGRLDGLAARRSVDFTWLENRGGAPVLTG